MNYTENYEGIKLDVQAVDIEISDAIQESIRKKIAKLKRHAKKIDSIDVYFKEEANQATNTKSVRMRVGVPGNDVFAQDEGDNWYQLLDNVEDKLVRQLQKK
ncbi:ribosome hibernation-promoting factor, HPF/YfiA family [Pontibacter cellulosilyticus]|uniref:Ribosome hibernation promoting factor n=1 Tax=Pontibacter cellulosilyticus TaxID=1720253 RepID=A0A923N6L8_9BACT|nr:ribosome-associated translation inhibitor RaiA [Pontibacter cellulosilyticus]MBC5992401.1 ribosome-associated translation inhibitor RaiA [Pontibacter cellulosilyticus]